MSVRPSINATFHEVLTAAVRDISENGYDDIARLDDWLRRLRLAAIADLPSPQEIQSRMQLAMQTVFDRTFSKSAALRYHPGIPRFTLERLKPFARAELDKRILASANLIKLNREQAIEKTLQRFSGWATSIPDQGSLVVDKVDVKEHIAKPIQQIKYEARRVSIDQGHKLIDAVNDAVAKQSGAIAAKWRSHFKQAGYDARPDHADRDSKIYLIRGSWAHDQGLVKPGPDGYTDQIERPGELVFCFPGESKVPFADSVEVAYRRWYDGELAVITTDSGKTLRATPNHPILTTRGWVAAGELKEGDDVIEVADEIVKPVMPEADDDRAVPSIAEIFSALNVPGSGCRIGGSGDQFHGDGREGYVDIVGTARPLSFGMMTSRTQGLDNLQLSVPDLSAPSRGAFQFFVKRCLKFAARFMGLSRSRGPLLTSHSSGHGEHGLPSASNGNSSGDQSIKDRLPGGSESIGDCQNALPGNICGDDVSIIQGETGRPFVSGLAKVESKPVDGVIQARSFPADDLGNLRDGLPFVTKATDVVKVERASFSGHVFNLQTRDGWYVTDGIIAHNCRCYYVHLNALRELPEEMLTAKGKQLLEETRIKRPALA
jgi:intein/homing endonuclease